MANTISFIESFLNEAEIYCNGILEGDNKKSNKADKKLSKIYEKIKKTNSVAELKKIITHENEGIRFCVAATIIKEFPESARKTLEGIVNNDTLFSSLATIILDLWKKGQL